VLSAHRVVKQYGSTTALRGVDFAVQPGEIVGVIGANGAGKSTLIGILSGATRPTTGEVRVDGAAVHFSTAEDAARAGIATVQQDVDAALVPDLTVAENLVLDQIASGALGALPGRARVRREAAVVAAGLDIDLAARVSMLRTSDKQQLLIARALHRGARVLILDEPTAALSVAEQRDLHRRVRDLAAAGTAIVYITHHLAEISALCSRVVAIREGLVAGEYDAPFSAEQLVNSILGDLVTPVRESRVASDERVLEAIGVRARADTPPLDVTVHAGEVLGITGLLGSGKTELLRQIVGADRLLAGALRFEGRDYRPRHPRDAVRAGIGFVPEDRRTQAEFGDWDVAKNVTLPDLRRYRRFGVLRARAEVSAGSTAISRLAIVSAGPRAGIRSLSGGNRQKVIVARWLAAGSRLLVLDEPFRGVDLGARADIAALLRSGDVVAALVASSDPEEILEVADRILVVADGRIVAEVLPHEVDAEKLATMMIAAPVGAEKAAP
jgi:simple sugar transport system ATP-binding protein